VNFEVAVNGRPWKVAIEAGEQPGECRVVMEGETRLLNASWIDADTLSLIEGFSVREVRFDRHKDALSVAFDGKSFEAVVVRNSRLKPRPTDSVNTAPVERDVSHAVKAPMPGRIVRVLVAVGDRVASGQGVVIVEAMKMENELRSTKDGVVKEVNVQQGAAIETGTVLVVVE